MGTDGRAAEIISWSRSRRDEKQDRSGVTGREAGPVGRQGSSAGGGDDFPTAEGPLADGGGAVGHLRGAPRCSAASDGPGERAWSGRGESPLVAGCRGGFAVLGRAGWEIPPLAPGAKDIASRRLSGMPRLPALQLRPVGVRGAPGATAANRPGPGSAPDDAAEPGLGKLPTGDA